MRTSQLLASTVALLGLSTFAGVVHADPPVGGTYLWSNDGRILEARIWDAGNGAIVVAGTRRIRTYNWVQTWRVLADGSAVGSWVDESSNGDDLKPAPDGSGGAWVPGGYYDVYIRHLLADGTSDPAFPVFRTVAATTSQESWSHACADGSGGVYVSWMTYAGSVPIRLQHFSSNGTIVAGWPAAGLVVTSMNEHFFNLEMGHTLVSDGAGGVIVVWPAVDVMRAKRVLANGTLAASWPSDGLAVGTLAPFVTIQPSVQVLAPAPERLHVMTLCGEQEGQLTLELCAVDLAGATPTVSTVLQLPSMSSGAGRFRLAADGAGGVLAAIPGSVASVRHVLNTGAQDAAWPPNGIPLPATTYIAVSRLAVGEFAVATDDGRDSLSRPIPRVRWFLADGTADPGAPANGYEVDTHLAYGGSGGYVNGLLAVAPRDARIVWTGSVILQQGSFMNDVRFSRSPEPNVLDAPVSVRRPNGLSFAPNPGRDRVQVRFTLGQDEAGSLEVFDLSGRCVTRTAVQGTGADQVVPLESLGLLHPGLHFARLSTATRVLSGRFAIAR